MTTQTTETTFTNVTLYTRGDGSLAFHGNVHKIECRSLTIRVGPYAQYTNAVTVEFTPKGKRRARTMTQTRADILVLDGFGHPDPDSATVPTVAHTPGVTVERGRYRSCDPRWQGDFDAKIAPYADRIVADYRNHVVTEKSYR